MSALLACSSPSTSPLTASLADGLAIDAYVDTDPDPHIVEVQMVAAVGQAEFLTGKSTEVWGYRDGARPDSQVSVPGPLLEAHQGDLVRVHFRNELPWSTTVHWHGPRVPIAMDGSMSSQTSIVPGGTFDYEFVVRDAGTFWYHPHVLADTEVSRGLYGPIVVRDDPGLEAHLDRVLVLSDAKLGDDGGWLPSETHDLIEGRRGGTLLVNGRVRPRVPALAGGRERWRLINASNARFFELALEGHDLTVVGWDGGLLPAPYSATTLRIAPGERYELIVEIHGEVGSAVTLSDVAHEPPGDAPTPAELLVLDLVSQATSLPPLSTTHWPTFVPPAVGETTTTRTVSLSGPFERDGDIDFRLNDQRWPFTTPIAVRRGDTEVWQVQNTTERDEPFHIHGVFFTVLERNGEKPSVQGWKDTAVVPARGDLRLAVTYEERGMWMFHSHILEHAEHGMMSEIHVELFMKSRLFVAIVAVGASLVGCGSEASSADPTVQGASTSGAAGAAQAEPAGAAGTGGTEGNLAGGGGLSGESGQSGSGPGGTAGAGGQEAGGQAAGGQGGEATAAGAGGQEAGGATGGGSGEAGAGGALNVAGEGGQGGAEEAGAAGASEEGGSGGGTGHGESGGWHPTK